MNIFSHISHVWQQHRAFQTALAELKSYSDRELGELGLSRSDVTRVAYEEAERRMAEQPNAPQARQGRIATISVLAPSS